MNGILVPITKFHCMLQPVMSSFPRFLLAFLSIIVLSSCVSLRYGYLGPASGSFNDTIVVNFISEKQKLRLQTRTDSLLKVISEQKKKKRHLLGLEINQLYSDFGVQLNGDRHFQYLLNKQPFRKDSLTYDQYLAVLELLSSAASYDKSYQKERLVRRAINRGDSGNDIPKHVLQKSRNFLYSPAVRKSLERNYIRYYNSKTDSLYNLLPPTCTAIALQKRILRSNDQFHSFIHDIVYGGSYVVGNTIGLFHLKTDRERNAKLLAAQLRPFDLVVMKSPYHLTDQFIPGYFGHVGIWLGNDLTAKLTHKVARSDDSKGQAMIEVLRSGVKISTVREFCDGDIFLVLRPTRLSAEQRRILLSNASKQLKKDYDFNFDIESPESITCTELVYLTYDFIDWQTRYTWSRYTLSPDDLVLTALKNKQFEFSAFINEGAVMFNTDTTFIRSLVGFPSQ